MCLHYVVFTDVSRRAYATMHTDLADMKMCEKNELSTWYIHRQTFAFFMAGALSAARVPRSLHVHSKNFT